jgi:hypothetical protein
VVDVDREGDRVVEVETQDHWRQSVAVEEVEHGTQHDQDAAMRSTQEAPHSHWHKAVQALGSPLWICLLAALLMRVWLVVHTNGVIDGDEALVGIQAEHILRGELPVYFYGQVYMGSLEAYLMAMLFAIAGPSVWTLRAEPTLLSLVVVWLTWRLAAALAETAQLPPNTKLVFQTIATLFAAISPLYNTVLQLRTLGGYIETFMLMLMLLLSALQLTRRWRDGASEKELALRWGGIGFVVGLGLWVDPLIISAILAAASWMLVFLVKELLQIRKKADVERWNSFQDFVARLLLSGAAFVACCIGLLPALIWGRRNQWANFQYMLQFGKLDISLQNNPNIPKQHIALIEALIHLYQGYVAPRIISGALPVESAALSHVFVILFAIGLIFIAGTVLLVVFSLVWHHPLLVSIQKLAALPLIFGLWTAIVFCSSSASAFGLQSLQVDSVGRYAAPLMLALPFFYATLITVVSMLLLNWRRHRRSHEQIIVGNDSRAESPYVASASRLPVPLILQGMLCVFVMLYCLATAYTYGQANPGYTFQTPACTMAPANDGPLIAYLEQQHVRAGWALTWIGNPIIFKTQENIIIADPRYIVSHYFGAERMPAYTEDVLHAQHPAFLAFVRHNDAYPLLLRYLDSMHVTYQAKRFVSEPGTDILVVTGLSRAVPLKYTAIFQQVFPNCMI